MKKNIGLIFGGNSVEHEISIISALQALENLDKSKYNVIPIYLTKDNNFYSSEDFISVKAFQNLEEIPSKYKIKTFIKKGNIVCLEDINKNIFQRATSTEIDLFFPIVHGTNVEDGKLQGYLSMFDIPIVGPSTLSGALGQDKSVSKDLLKSYRIPQTKYVWVEEGDVSRVKNIVEKLEYPLILKPASLGSSIGIEIVNNEAELVPKIKEAFTYDSVVVIENKLKDIRELNISVVKLNGEIKTSSIEEVYGEDAILSFDDKYKSKSKVQSKGMASVTRVLPAKIDDELKKEIVEKAKRSYEILRCKGVIRVDIILSNNNIYINEINNVPGSLSYYLWEDVGVSYPKLLDLLIEEAIKDKYLRQKKVTSFTSNVLNSKTLKLNK